MSLCEHCEKKEGELRINPYTQDIDNEEIEEFICDECFEILCDEI